MPDTGAVSSAVEHLICNEGVAGSNPARSTKRNIVGIKKTERFCGSQNRAIIFFKTLSAYGGSREFQKLPPIA